MRGRPAVTPVPKSLQRALRFAVVALALLAPATVLAVGGNRVSQLNRRFSPDAITVPQGTSLELANDDEFLHHAYIKTDAFNFDAGEIEPGNEAVVKLAKTGTFTVLCAIHPKMKLTITVQ